MENEDEIDEVFSEDSEDENSVDGDANLLHSVATWEEFASRNVVVGKVVGLGEVVAAEVVEEIFIKNRFRWYI